MRKPVDVYWGLGAPDRPGFGRIGRSLANQRPPFYRPTDRLLSSPPRAQPPIGLRAALLHRRLASGWAGRMIHFHIPLSLVSCIVFPVQLYSTEGDSQLRLFGAGLALGPSLAGLGCVLLPHGPGSERGGGSLGNWKERRGVRPKGRWINIWRCICKGKAKPSRLPTKLERGRGTRPAN
jgi:hypothetical protein